MVQFNERFLVDESGTRIGVVLDPTAYQKILEDLEELDSIRAYDAAKADVPDAIPFDQALAEIQRERE